MANESSQTKNKKLHQTVVLSYQEIQIIVRSTVPVMAAKKPVAKDPSAVNYVHQNDILCETIRKEQNNQKLYTSYSINPFKKSKCDLFFFVLMEEKRPKRLWLHMAPSSFT